MQLIKLNYYWLLFFYVAASVASQFLTTTPVHLFNVGSVAFWLPLSAVTLVPLVDVLRCFTQHQAEREGLLFKHVAPTMLITSLAVSGLCVMYLGLPVQIFTAVLAAITIGGAVDLLVFRHMGKLFKSPVKRMAVSNLMATLTGSGIVFAVAFTDLFFTDNPLARTYDEAVVGWLTQSMFIWLAGIVIAIVMNRLHKSN